MKRIFALLLISVMMLLTACGNQAEDVPELLEPIVANEAYRPVEVGDIGTNVIKTGYIVPTDYCYFYNTSATLKELYVNVGDYVEAGTVLAEADGESSESTISDLQASLDKLKQSQSIKQDIFEETQKEYDYKIKACEESEDEEAAASYRTQKAVSAENNRYDTMLYEYQIEKLNSQIQEQEELQSDLTLVADHSGYVTYVRALVTDDGSDNSSVSATDNVVVLSDYDDIYIELTGENVTKNGFTGYNTMYTVISGTKYEIEEYSYTNQELAMAQSYGTLPYVRFNLKDADNNSILTMGTSIPLYFSTSTITDVLIIGNDSLYQEGEQYFVYVKTDSSDKEKRYIEIGESDNNYTEVVSGLSEGELVYYESDSLVPGNYTTYNVTLSDYEVTGYILNKNYSMEDTQQIIYSAPTGGYFETFDLTVGQVVKKGDLLFTIDSGGGSAKLLEINAEITNTTESYNDQIDGYNDQIDELKAQIKAYKAGELVATSTDADPSNLLYVEEQLTCEIEIVKYNKKLAEIDYNSSIKSLKEQKAELSENNDGNGNISVYAECDGVVLSKFASTGYELQEGDKVVSIGSDENQEMFVNPVDSESEPTGGAYINLAIGQEVTLVDQSDTTRPTLTARVIATTGDSSKVYVTTRDGNVYVSKSGTGDNEEYYLGVDDESFYDNPVGYNIKCTKQAFEDIIVIPKTLVYQEADKTADKEYYYVWKIVDDEMVKQYVTISEAVTTSQSYCILSGLSEGDVIAKEMTD